MLIILFYQASSFLFKSLTYNFLIHAVIAQIFNPTTALAIFTGIPTEEAKVEMETHPVPIEARLSRCSI